MISKIYLLELKALYNQYLIIKFNLEIIYHFFIIINLIYIVDPI